MSTRVKSSPYLLAATVGLLSLLMVAGFLLLMQPKQVSSSGLAATIIAAPQAEPDSVTVAGDLQSELGCPGDWQADCAVTHLTYDANDGVWQENWLVPAGSYEYKAALNDSWTENYGVGGAASGANIPLSVTAEMTVSFFYDHKSHWIIDDVNAIIATAAGNLQSELGCSGDWDPGCLRSWLQDLDDDGIYTLEATGIPAASYEFKVAIDQGWTESYGVGGGADNIPFTINDPTDRLIITWDSVSKIPTAEVQATVGPYTITLVGNLQSELGCVGDWSPTCTNTMLTDMGNGVWRGEFEIVTTTVPYTWEYKIALDGAWTEAYPANNVALPLTDTSTTVRFYYDHKTHAVLDDVNDFIAVAAGGFQSELGCSGDWQPECVRTLLTDVDGDGVYRFQTMNIPAGSYEFKVALDEGWTTSYPGDNVTLNVPEDGANVLISWDSATTNVSHLVQSSATLAQAPVTHTIQDDLFYFVMTDRFQDGDATNNQGGLTGDRSVHGYDPTDVAYYHGGDIAGLIAGLDYLDGMGVTAIWVTPVFDNNPVQGNYTGYHGYWIRNFTTTDAHLGSDAELTAFIAAAHTRGIKVFLDIVINHTADLNEYQGGVYNYRNKTDFPYRDTTTIPFDDRDYINGVFPPLEVGISFPYVPVTTTNLRGPAWLNNPIYYHNRGNIANWDDAEQSVYGDFSGLDDLFTEQPFVRQGMIDIYKDWVDFGVDGFRIDTVKHVNLEFWQAFAPEILDYAETRGNPDFFFFGEVYSGDRYVLSRYTREGMLPAVLDFRFQGQATNFANGANAVTLQSLFADDDYFTDADSNAYQLTTFLSNHDAIGRLGASLVSNNTGAADAELLARDTLAHGLLYFARGVPVVYYGDEQGFTGDGGTEGARQDMFPSQVASYQDDDQIGTTDTPADDNFDATHPLYVTLGEFAALYQAHPALRSGAQIHRYAVDTAGVYAFSRIDRAEKMEYVLAFNNAEVAQTAVFTTFEAEMDFTAIYTGGNVTVPATLTADANRQLTVTVPALGFVIYRADAALTDTLAAPGIAFSALADGDDLAGENDLAEIAVTLDADRLAEVTFAVMVGDALEYEVIGVDNNAPYRVFFDVSNLALGTPVHIRAIVNDLSGHYAFADVSVTVGEYVAPVTGDQYAIIHYHRPAGDYGDWSSSDSSQFWGLHLWGNAIHPDEGTSWDQPKKFAGIDDFGAYVAIRLQDTTQPVNYIVHRGNDKDTPNDRNFDPAAMPELWIVQGDAANYGSRAEAQGYVTIHYTRTDGIFTDWGLHLWQDGYGMTAWPDRHMPDGYDDFGAVFIISDTLYTELDFTKPLSFLFHNGAGAQSGDLNFLPTEHADVWVQAGDDTVYAHRGAIEDFAVIHYRRLVGDYGDYASSDFNDFWGVHTWNDVPGPDWATPYKSVRQDDFGVVFELPLTGHNSFGYILHRGGEKDPEPDQSLDLVNTGYEIWVGQGLASDAGIQDQYHHPAIPMARMKGVAAGDLSKAQAYWLAEDTLAWSIAANPALDFFLYYDADAGLTLNADGISGGNHITLTVGESVTGAIAAKFPHLAGLPTLLIDAADLALVPDILKSQFAIAAYDGAGALVDATSLQIPGVLDDLYTYTGDLGINYDNLTPTLRLWAPTAQDVVFHLFDDALTATTSVTHPMAYDANFGVWSVTGEPDWTGQYYLYEVVVYAPAAQDIVHNLVTDPYAVSLSMNSTRSQIVDLTDPTLTPAGWDTLAKPELIAPEDIVIYEMHIRDFSANDASVPEDYVGTFKAFTLPGSNGVQHLQALADAGLTHLHLLPVMDIATINEDKSTWQDADFNLLATYPPSSTEQQAALAPYRDLDGFNWGYDPLHYGVPEGSYATNPDGTTRIVEFREMVQALNAMGLRVVVDVVYNHTNASGQSPNAVLDRIVPGYYHRLSASGQVENSTCCANTASEHAMMEKLMVDTLLIWARDYKVDGFRFDLMGHHMKSNMLNVRAALDDLTLADDGVDGSAIYMYGEGWNFGEVQDNARGVNATQANMAGTGIGTFNDRARDAVRGGGPFDSGESLRSNQGFINGLYYDPNAWNNGSPAELARLHNAADLIRVGLAGNLADYAFIDASGTLVSGKDVDYNGSPAGYTALPVENIIYVSKHDNQTLYDNNQYKLPDDAAMDERVRAQNMGLSFVSLAQGVPFLQAGSDMLRSKSLDRDSYNSGDWFNKLDFTYQDNNWGAGLPSAAVGGQSDNWPIMAPLLGNPDLKPTSTDILSSAHHLQDMLTIRQSTPLFRLQTLEDVQARLAFHNTGPAQIPGLIVMSLSDADRSLGSLYSLVVVLFNANDEAQTFTEASLVDMALELHPVQVNGYDPVVKTTTFDPATGAFVVPARTTAVFVNSIPIINVIPSALDVTLNAGMTAAEILTVSNTGGANLIWQLLEDPNVDWLQVDWETTVGLPILTPPGETDTASTFFDASGLLPGVYTTTLIVSSNDPARPQITIPVTLTVPCIPVEITSLTSDSPVVLGTTIHFTATVTGSQPITYAWDFGGAGVRGGTDTNPTFIYDEAGTYTVSLTVANGCGTDTQETVVTVEPPAVCYDVESVGLMLITTGDVYTDTVVHFSAAVSPAAATIPYRYTLDFGDGPGDVLLTANTTIPFTHTFAVTGTYTVEIAVWNCAMTEPVTDQVTVTVSARIPPTYTLFLPLVMRAHP